MLAAKTDAGLVRPTGSMLPPPHRVVTGLLIAGLSTASVGWAAASFEFSPVDGGFGPAPVPHFGLLDTPLPHHQPPHSPGFSAAASGGPLAQYKRDLLAVDPDSGLLVRTDAAGERLASLAIGSGVAQVVVDEANDRAYVSDRAGDRVVVVDLDDGLHELDAWPTPAEPYGLALSPDGTRLLVTSVADGRVSAYATVSGDRQWSLALGPEPRGVALRHDGRQAVVTFLTLGAVAQIDGADTDTPEVHYRAIESAPTTQTDKGRAFARHAFAALYIGHDTAVVPHQESTPQMAASDDPFMGRIAGSGYGGGSDFVSPIKHRLAFLPTAESSGSTRLVAAQVRLHQPRAMAYNPTEDVLFVAGYGSDDVLAIRRASQSSAQMAWQMSVARAGKACGPMGLVFDDEVGELAVLCSLHPRIVRLDEAEGKSVRGGPVLAKSTLSAPAQRGRELFRRGNAPELSRHGAMACSSCHAEARADGLTWFLDGAVLQTPLLSGRLGGAHPFKWDGKDPTLTASLKNTVGRLGGRGLSTREVHDLAAFLRSTPPPRRPSIEDSQAVARGKALFHSDKTRCATCHRGPLLTDNRQYALAADLPKVDTPSLIGLAHSAPYYHDASAATLEALLEGRGNIHGMGRTSKLSDAEIDDLIAYLNTL